MSSAKGLKLKGMWHYRVSKENLIAKNMLKCMFNGVKQKNIAFVYDSKLHNLSHPSAVHSLKHYLFFTLQNKSSMRYGIPVSFKTRYCRVQVQLYTSIY